MRGLAVQRQCVRWQGVPVDVTAAIVPTVRRSSCRGREESPRLQPPAPPRAQSQDLDSGGGGILPAQTALASCARVFGGVVADLHVPMYPQSRTACQHPQRHFLRGARSEGRVRCPSRCVMGLRRPATEKAPPRQACPSAGVGSGQQHRCQRGAARTEGRHRRCCAHPGRTPLAAYGLSHARHSSAPSTLSALSFTIGRKLSAFSKSPVRHPDVN